LIFVGIDDCFHPAAHRSGKMSMKTQKVTFHTKRGCF